MIYRLCCKVALSTAFNIIWIRSNIERSAISG